ncbi:MAG: peptidoglycan recognition family protein [Phycisphaerales bacterium]
MNPPLLGRRFVLETGLVGGLSLLAITSLAGCRSAPLAALPGPVRPAPLPPSPRPLPPSRPTTSVPPAGPNPEFLPRSAWTRAGVARPRDINPMLPVSRITIHHDGMDAFTSASRSDAAARIETIRAAHVGQRKFADIGYHYIIDPAGRVWEGRSTNAQGAHVQDNNEGNLGIMCLGNFDRHRPSAAQASALDRFVAAQMLRFRVPIGRVYTHQEINPTACPGRNLQSYMIATRATGGNMRLAASSGAAAGA